MVSKTEIYEDCPFFAEANAVGVHYHHSWQSFKKGETWIDKHYQPYGPSYRFRQELGSGLHWGKKEKRAGCFREGCGYKI